MKRILVVEDNAQLAIGLQRNLEHDGYRVTTVGTATAAMSLAAREVPDLIVLDLGLPDRDGYHVLEQLRARGAETPVLILSARGMEADKVRGFRLGADDYVVKPCGVLELMARVAALLRRRNGDNNNIDTTNGAPSDDVLRTRYGLTGRQVEIARLLGQGYANAEIAGILGISAFTARNHTEQVLAKLGAATRARVGAMLRGQV